jgi:hypothetical protein
VRQCPADGANDPDCRSAPVEIDQGRWALTGKCKGGGRGTLAGPAFARYENDAGQFHFSSADISRAATEILSKGNHMVDETGEGKRPRPLVMNSLTLAIPPAEIALFKAIIESYDNLATLRTEDPVRHHLKLYFAPEARAELELLIESLSARFAIVRLAST